MTLSASLNRRLLTAVTFVGALLNGAVADATQPPGVASYRFAGSQSLLEARYVGIEPPDVKYWVSGTFDLEFRPQVTDPPTAPTARFTNVDAVAQNPLLDQRPLNLDKVLNLSGLYGVELPVGAPFDVYHFTGSNEQGSSVSLFAQFLGPWLRLYGETKLPPGQLAGVEYVLQSVARTRPWTDFNDDGQVDGQDLGILTANWGADKATAATGDANGDGRVDGADFLAWQQHEGERPPIVLPAAAMASRVPEPSSLVVLLASAVTVGVIHARRRGGAASRG